MRVEISRVKLEIASKLFCAVMAVSQINKVEGSNIARVKSFESNMKPAQATNVPIADGTFL